MIPAPGNGVNLSTGRVTRSHNQTTGRAAAPPPHQTATSVPSNTTTASGIGQPTVSPWNPCKKPATPASPPGPAPSAINGRPATALANQGSSNSPAAVANATN